MIIIRHFSSFSNIFSILNKLLFFRFLVDFCIAQDPAVPFLFLFQKDFDLQLMNLKIFVYVKNFIEKILEDRKLPQINFIMVFIIRKILALLEISRITKRFLQSIIDFKKQIIFFITYNDEKIQGLKKDK